MELEVLSAGFDKEGDFCVAFSEIIAEVLTQEEKDKIYDLCGDAVLILNNALSRIKK